MAALNTTIYRGFRGVDYASGQTQTASNRSPYAVNLIPDADGFPEKRPGWRILAEFPDNPVLGIYRFRRTSGEQETILHRQNDMVLYNEKTMQVRSVLLDGLTGTESYGFQMSGKFWLLTGKEYVYYDGFKSGHVTDIAYVPLIMAGRKPSGGGTMIENINLLTSKRKVSFLGDGSTKAYQLPSTGIDSVDEILVNNIPTTAYTSNLDNGTVTFTTAPSAPKVTGEDNVEITYSKTTRETLELKITAEEIEHYETGDATKLRGLNINNMFPDLAKPVQLYNGSSYGLYVRWYEEDIGWDYAYLYPVAASPDYVYDSSTGILTSRSPFLTSLPMYSNYYITIKYYKNGSSTSTTFYKADLERLGAIVPDRVSVTSLNLSSEKYSDLNIVGVTDISMDNVSHPVGSTLNQAEDGSWTYAPDTKIITFNSSMEISDRYIIKYETPSNENLAKVLGCRFGTLYGYGANDRVFLSGNEKYPNYDWWSELDNPAYIGDLNYAMTGAESSAIMGYAYLGSSLLILKEDSQSDSTLYVRTASLGDDGIAYFPQRQSAANIGLIARGGTASISDEPLFLSRNGVFGVVTNGITTEKIVQNRSYYIDSLLKKEKYPENASAVSVDSRVYLSFPDSGNMYILDGKQGRVSSETGDSSYVYECYNWSGIPAKRLFAIGDALMFVSVDGRLCRFNSDIETDDKWSDNGEPIECYWATKMDDDGDFMLLKTLYNRGCGVLAKPYSKSHIDVLIRTEEHAVPVLKASGLTGTFDWQTVDLKTVNFNSSDAPQVIKIRAKIRNYTSLQIICRNNVVNEGFGVLGIEKKFVAVGYKR